MPPFRYLGNILGCAGVRFGLGSVCVFAWARAREGEDCARALALTEAGRVPKMEDARFGSRSFSRFDIDRFAPL